MTSAVMTAIFQRPTEQNNVLEHILEQCDHTALVQLSETCRKLRDVIFTTDALWNHAAISLGLSIDPSRSSRLRIKWRVIVDMKKKKADREAENRKKTFETARKFGYTPHMVYRGDYARFINCLQQTPDTSNLSEHHREIVAIRSETVEEPGCFSAIAWACY
jgi:hypothetical protein